MSIGYDCMQYARIVCSYSVGFGVARFSWMGMSEPLNVERVTDTIPRFFYNQFLFGNQQKKSTVHQDFAQLKITFVKHKFNSCTRHVLGRKKMKILKPLIYASIITLSVGCNNNSTNNVDEKSNIIDVDNNIYELGIECKQNGDTIVGISHNDLYAIILRGPKNTSSCFGCDYDYETPQEIILYDLLTKEKQILFKSHKKIKHKEGSKDAVEWELNNFEFPKFVEDKDGAALLLWEIDHGNDGYLFPLNEHNFEKKYFYRYDYSEYELSQMINDNDTTRYVWYDWNYLRHDDINNCPIGYYRLYKINTKGDIIWEDDSLRIFRAGGESPIGGIVFAKAHARILNDMDNFKSELAKLLRGYAEYGDASMGVKYILETTYSDIEKHASDDRLLVRTTNKTCNIALEISQDIRTILNGGTNGYIPELIFVEDTFPMYPSSDKYIGKTIALKGSAKTMKISELFSGFSLKNFHSFNILNVEERYTAENHIYFIDACKTTEKEELKETKYPTFPDGTKAFHNFIAKNIVVPQGYGGGLFYVAFIIDENGKVVSPHFTLAEGPEELETAILDVFAKIPNFEPGEDTTGKKVPFHQLLPIYFNEDRNRIEFRF